MQIIIVSFRFQVYGLLYVCRSNDILLFRVHYVLHKCAQQDALNW